MQVHALTYDEFSSTFSQPMLNVSEAAEEILEIWDYVEEVLTIELDGFDTEAFRVTLIYETSDRRFQHILIPLGDENILLAIIINIPGKEIYGYFILNLLKEYGLMQ